VARPTDRGRFEYKYALPASMRERIVEIADPHVQPDPHGASLEIGGAGYEVHTLYLDTPRLHDYYQRMDERRVRNRLRVRTYGRAGQRQPVFLENKRKLENWVVKHRVRVADTEQWAADGDTRPWIRWARQVGGRGRYTAEHFVRLVEGLGRIPTTVTHYIREVYVPRRSSGQKLRLTIDHRVQGSVAGGSPQLYPEPTVDLLPRDWIVLELKYNEDRPAWMRRICRELRLRAVPVSKANLSVARGLRPHARREVRYVTPRPLRQIGWGL